ncbi:lysophosphatidylserine lipase ABHD12-like [Onthophagus taurus]|uniref:lysophosphatidylserine lipase ABHD12-like n=1 Tax=Onthophagus taurus TaxID=166361 RepID=UPI0039BEB667
MPMKYTTAGVDPPEITRRKRHNYKKWIKIIVIVLVVIILLSLIILFVGVPLVFMWSFAVQEALMFTRFGLPTNPSDFHINLPGATNFYVTVQDKETNKLLSLGVWHLLPWSVVNATIEKKDNRTNHLEMLENTIYPIVIHFHGTGETRLDAWKMGKLLRYFFHVFLFDYRGYGDSTPGIMREEAVVEDCVQFYKWVMTKTNSKIYIWGHSLGASLALHTAKILGKQGVNIEGIILEAAFTSMFEEIPHHPYGKIFAWLPYFNATIRKPLLKNGFHFDNVQYVQEITAPILQFHAEDDSIIPLALGRKLYDASVSPNRTVTFVQVPRSYGCDHFFLYIYPDLPIYIQQFLYGNTKHWVRHFIEAKRQNSRKKIDKKSGTK